MRLDLEAPEVKKIVQTVLSSKNFFAKIMYFFHKIFKKIVFFF